MTTVAETLEQVAALLEGGGWTQRAFARAANGDQTNQWHSQATSFCIAGGISRVCYNAVNGRWPSVEYSKLTEDCLRAVKDEIERREGYRSGNHTLGVWNDRATRNEAEVIDVLRAAARWERVHAETH